MPRLALGIEYDGSAFAGWQFQSHARSVQGELQRALTQVADHPVELTAAGRTDAGVHALAMVAHFDTTAERPLHAWVLGTNANVAPEISVLWAHVVADDFHARHQATARRYQYRILDRRVRPALERQRVCWIRHELDAGRMHEAAQTLVGHHDFSAFRAAECQSPTPVRKLMEVSVQRAGPYVDIRVRANAFLHHMVRNIAGSLILVGRGERTGAWLQAALHGRDRREAGPTAPPEGLYFAGADYPAGFGLPSGKLQHPPTGAAS
jgi:tRNA pseudouridine38-40 synthase